VISDRVSTLIIPPENGDKISIK